MPVQIQNGWVELNFFMKTRESNTSQKGPVPPADQDFYEFREGFGTRHYDLQVDFQGGFPQPPQVHVAISGYDTGKEDNPRIKVSVDPQNVGQNGFTLRFETWADARIHLVRADWLAYTT